MDLSDEESKDASENRINLTGFLFGNINEAGELESDVLDSDAQKQLSALSQFGLGSILHDVIGDEIGTKSSSESDSDNDNDKGETVDFDGIKESDAVDYSDIVELADDDDDDDVKSSHFGYEADDEFDQRLDDSTLMPPPNPEIKRVISRPLNTPLAAMLPEKYAHVDVTELFPDFRHDKVLRFSRLFGPGKPSSLPQIWRSVRRRRRKKRKRKRSTNAEESDSGSDPERVKATSKYGEAIDVEVTPDQLASDDETKLLSDVKKDPATESQTKLNENEPRVADWRFGPAQIWYDMLEVPETGHGFDYGFKLKRKETDVSGVMDLDVADDAFLMVSQVHWEDDVVWDGNDIKHKVQQKLNSKVNPAGWLPVSKKRTAQAFNQPGKAPASLISNGVTLGSRGPGSGKGKMKVRNIFEEEAPTDDTWYSIFPVENEELVYGSWENDVIWDAENMDDVPPPKILTLDPNDENIILGIPEDVDPAKINSGSVQQPKIKIPHPHVKKSKLLLGKAGVINVLAEDTPPPPSKSPDRDPFNISNDAYYMPKSEPSLRLKVGGGNLIQHSIPVVELRPPFVQTHMGTVRLRNFHRPPMKRYSHGALANPGPHVIQPLLRHIKKKAKAREQERLASGGGDVFFMRTPADLTGRDGDLILVEFCEEHPPLMNQVGMCSKIKNYYKRKAGKDTGPQDYKYGEVAYAHTSPFLGILHPGQSIQAIENNMYRTPIYEQTAPASDFLVIRTRQGYFIREIDALYVAGQQCPLYEVPGPNSKRANNFVRDFLQVYIYRLFWKSKDSPRRIRMDDIKRAFQNHSESSIRKRLKLCADFKRTGMDSNWWVLKPEFRLPSEEEIRAMVSPEQCCAYFSMIAAEQRLKDAGYGEKFLFTPNDDDDEDLQLKMDDEVKVAPWNTTRAYIQAIKGKCLLQLTGPADPTGCGEGFSYVRVPNKPTLNKEEQESQPKRIVTGTDADLRKLSLNNAKALLRKFGVPEDEIKKLSRWEVIDVVRTLSTEKAKAGEDTMTKFSRGNRFSIAEHQERYKEECQRIFDLQNRVLASTEVLSTDEGESSDDGDDSSDIEEMGKNLENMLANKKTSTQLSLEKEEQERQELRKMILEGGEKKLKKDDDDGTEQASTVEKGRVLRITRRFRNADGKEYVRTELVRKQGVIDAYLKIRTTKDENFIRQFALLDEQQKEEMKREKRRIQEQLRRIKRNQEKERLMNNLVNSRNPVPSESPVIPSASKSLLNPGTSFGGRASPPTPTPIAECPLSPALSDGALSGDNLSPKAMKKRMKMMKQDLKLKCGACGKLGHMRTNRACPLYQGAGPSGTAALSEDQDDEFDNEINTEDEDLINVEDTKLKLSNKLLKHAEELKKRDKLSKREKLKQKRKRMNEEIHCDYLTGRQRIANRRRTDPLVVLSTMLENILNDLRDQPEFSPFVFPVNGKLVVDYYKIVQRPMDLQTIRENLRAKRYQSREEFLADINQILNNSVLYNGQKSSITIAAERMLNRCVQLLAQIEDKLMLLEKAINPLLDDNDQVALTFILENVVSTKLKVMTESWPFLKPVNKKLVHDYYTIVKKPMDLETISKKVVAHKYHDRFEFMKDVELILINCELYNGKESPFTLKAQVLVQACRATLAEYDTHLTQLEKNIAEVRERAAQEADLETNWFGDDDDEPQSKPEPVKIETPDIASQGDAGDKPRRGRGRPRKRPLLPAVGNVEDDLHFSSEDEFDEVQPIDGDVVSISAVSANAYQHLVGEITGEDAGQMSISITNLDANLIDDNMMLADNVEIVANIDEQQFCIDDDSQQVAEAMVQLGNVAFYQPEGGAVHIEEIPYDGDSMDVDPNYDPSDFLMARPLKVENTYDDDNANDGSYQRDDEGGQSSGIKGEVHSDLAISDSDDEGKATSHVKQNPAQTPMRNIPDDDEEIWF